MSIVPSDSNEQSAHFQSPGLASRAFGEAFELKFHVNDAAAAFVEAWARKHLLPDRHGDDGSYRITSIYSDTPQFDVYHRSAGFKKRKFRARRYGESELVFLERKTKDGDRVRKKRVQIGMQELSRLADAEIDPEWSAAWFHRRIVTRDLRPVVCVSYLRTAFFGDVGTQPIRLTLDRQLRGARSHEWRLDMPVQSHPLLDGGAILELKFHLAMPDLLRELLPHLPTQSARVSKYRRSVVLCGLEGLSDSPPQQCAVP